MAANHRPDLILLDVMMPETDGLTVCRRLKADPELRAIPVILVTAQADEEDVVRGLDAGADDYVAKPVNRVVLALAYVRAARQARAGRVGRDEPSITGGVGPPQTCRDRTRPIAQTGGHRQTGRRHRA